MENKELSLYGITQEFEALDELISMDEGELSEHTNELTEYITTLLINKVDSFSGFVHKQEDEIEAAKKAIDRLKDFISVRENKLKRTDEYILACLDRLNTDKFVGEFTEIKARQPSKIVKITNENLIEPEYVIVETTQKVDKMRLKEDLKRGVICQGAELADGKRSVIFGNKTASKKKVTNE